jgi:hypothetical protein
VAITHLDHGSAMHGDQIISKYAALIIPARVIFNISWWIGFSQIISPSELLFGLLLRFCVIIIYCALN